MQKKKRITHLIKFWGILIIISIGTGIIIFDVSYSYNTFYKKANNLRTEYLEKQKNLIKYEVKKAIDMIDNRNYRLSYMLKEFTKERSNIAWSFIKKYYNEYKGKKNDKEIKKDLIDKLSFIKTDESNTYIIDLDNKSVSKIGYYNPKNNCKLPIDSLVGYSKFTNEGVYKYYCKNPKDNSSVKIFLHYKVFVPLHLMTFSEISLDNKLYFSRKETLLYDLSNIRFGKEGYIFVNTFNGDTLVSNGQLLPDGIKLWDAFDTDKEKIKDIFKKEYQAALKPDGDFIHYTWKKLSDKNIEYPKTSFIQGYPEFQWIIGAGFYNDDIEKYISSMYQELNRETQTKVSIYIVVIFIIVLLSLVLFNRIMNKLNNEFIYFISFFDKVTKTKENINIDTLQFIEFEQIADNANKMLSELWDSQNKLTTIIQSSPDPIYFKDMDGNINIANKAYLKLYDLDETEFNNNINKNFKELIHPNLLKTFSKCKESDLKAWNSKDSFYISEEVIEKPNGKILTFEVIKVPIFDVNGDKEGLLVIGRDITHRKEVENQLRKMKIVIEQSPVSIIIINNFGKIDYVNNKFCEISGYSKDEVLHKNYNFLIGKYTTNHELSNIKRTIYNGKVWTGEVLNENKSGEIYWEKVIIFSINDTNNQIMNFAVFKEDITKRKDLELELKKANENLKFQIKKELEKIRIQETIIQQQKRFADMGQMINAIAHQWRQPLNNISLTMQMIQSIHEGEDFGVDINDLFLQHEQIVQFMSGTIDDFRNYFSVKKEKREFNVIKEILSTIALLNAQLSSNKIDLDVFCKCKNCPEKYKIKDYKLDCNVDDTYYGLAGEFRQVILNIISNAKDAILEKRATGWNDGEIIITIKIEDDKFEIIIFNTGDPIKKDVMDKIFDPYFTTKENDKGTGIGLYMSKTIIENEMNGTIFAKNTEKGVEFHIIMIRKNDDEKQHSLINIDNKKAL